MPKDALRQELQMLACRTLLLDAASYLISIIFCGVTLSFALGLLLGTAVLFISLLLLQISIRRMAAEAKRSGTANQRRYQLFYGLRLAVFAVAFGTAVVFRSHISPAAVAIPMLYPRLIYTAGALFRKGSDSGKQKR